MYLVMDHSNPYAPYRDQYRLFADGDKALEWARSLGYGERSLFCFGVPTDDGFVNKHVCGDTNITIMKIALEP